VGDINTGTWPSRLEGVSDETVKYGYRPDTKTNWPTDRRSQNNWNLSLTHVTTRLENPKYKHLSRASSYPRFVILKFEVGEWNGSIRCVHLLNELV
jgi:hypothetical protein